MTHSHADWAILLHVDDSALTAGQISGQWANVVSSLVQTMLLFATCVNTASFC